MRIRTTIFPSVAAVPAAIGAAGASASDPPRASDAGDLRARDHGIVTIGVRSQLQLPF